jgi:hypothetical protein
MATRFFATKCVSCVSRHKASRARGQRSMATACNLIVAAAPDSPELSVLDAINSQVNILGTGWCFAFLPCSVFSCALQNLAQCVSAEYLLPKLFTTGCSSKHGPSVLYYRASCGRLLAIISDDSSVIGFYRALQTACSAGKCLEDFTFLTESDWASCNSLLVCGAHAPQCCKAAHFYQEYAMVTSRRGTVNCTC